MFRGKESSNRIELSRLVQELLNLVFRAPCSSWDGGGWRVPPTHVHMHVHACTHIHAHTCMHGKHDNFMQMAAPLGESLRIPYDVICTCTCVHMHACTCMHACMCAHVWGAPCHHPHPHPTTPTPRGDPQNQSKFNST